jgi:hypothetical protein
VKADAEPDDPMFADKRRTRLIIRRAPVPKPSDDSLSYLGGLPRLPPNLDWPMVQRREEDGQGDGPIYPNFIAQLDLESLPFWRGRDLLPTFGTIYIFCNTQFTEVGDPYCKILYFEGSSRDLPERTPPQGLMRIGGTYDKLFRSWLSDDDPWCGIDYKYALSFEWAPKPISHKTRSERHFTEAEWRRELALTSLHPLLMNTWPQTPLFVDTFRTGLIEAVRRYAKELRGEPWAGYRALLEVAKSIPQFDGEQFRWLGDAERTVFRTFLAGFIPELEALGRDASRSYLWSSYGLSRLIEETAYWCVSRGFLEGVFDQRTASGELYAAMVSAANVWQQWPHQILGAGSQVQDAPYEHADKAPLLQVSGSDFIACSLVGSSGVLQIWVPPDDLRAGHLDSAVATFEC